MEFLLPLAYPFFTRQREDICPDFFTHSMRNAGWNFVTVFSMFQPFAASASQTFQEELG